ncbi:MAG: T9SS type A sorting domain-containing protein, partial [Flavobacteriales bacterium]|nr:T9SS type A sorting domain-containing protein [Flavobacteriales bacterium]
GGSFNNPLSNFANMPGSGSTAPISQFNISQSNPDYIYVAKRIYHSYNQLSELWMTPDNGLTWTNITDGLNDSLYFNWVEIDNDDPLTAWVTVAGFEADEHIYQTTDGGANWTNITYDLPNLPANCIVHHDSSVYNMLYVGTDIGVYYSNDTLQSWLPYNDNLPNVIVSDLEIQYNDQKIYAATFGRGVWMTDLLVTEMVQPDTATVDTTTSGIDERMLFAKIAVELYPNPNNGEFTLSIKGFEGANLMLEIVDIMGKVVAVEQLSIFNGEVTKTIDYRLSDGMYFLKISHNKRMKSIRFVVE